MADETYSFTAARARLDEIVTHVRKKDVSLEASLDLLEEGVKLANQCTELIDHVDWVTAAPPASDADGAAVSECEDAVEDVAEASVEEGDAGADAIDEVDGAGESDTADAIDGAEKPE